MRRAGRDLPPETPPGTHAKQGRFRRSQRLSSAADFRRAFRSPRRSSDNYLVIYAAPNGLAYARLGLAISRSRTRNAAERNRIKRIVRESFRQHQRDLSGLDLVVTARKPLTRIASRHIAEALAGHWHRLGAHGSENMNNDSDRKA